MTINKKTVFALGLISSIGTWVLWLSEAPFYSSIGAEYESVGELGSIRQIATLMGIILAGKLIDQSNNLGKMFCVVELCTVFLDLILLYFLYGQQQTDRLLILLPVWTFARFLVAGISFTTSFKFLVTLHKNSGDISILHILMVQGSVVFGALVTMFLSLRIHDNFLVAVYLDLITSFMLFLFLFRKNEIKKASNTTKNKFRILDSIGDSVFLFWNKKLFPWNIIQFLFLISVGGFSVYSIQYSNSIGFISKDFDFSFMTMLYGVSLWFFGFIFIKKKNSIKYMSLFTVMLLINGIIKFQNVFDFTILKYIDLASYIICISAMLHLTNQKIISLSDPNKIAMTRASMVFYLNIAFAACEYSMGHLYEIQLGDSTAGILRILSATSILLLILYSRKRRVS